MDCNKEEARKAIEIAERKLSEKDHNGAKRFVSKAKTLYPILDGLEQISTMIHVYVSASNKTCGSESDWYGVLGVDPLADEETLKKQYKKLALLLHPDKNKFNGAEGAFKLVLHAWSLLSDKVKRVAYDHKRKRKERKNEQTPPPDAADRENQKRAERRFKKQQEKRAQQETADKAKEEESSSRKKKVSSTFWTMCTHCSTYSEHVRAHYLDKNSLCPFCSKVFVATEKFPEMVNGKPYIRFAPPPPKPQATRGNTSDTRNSMPKTPCSQFAPSRTFWTMCTHCTTYSEHVRADHLDKNSLCPFCGRVFVATEKFPEMLNGKPYIRFAPPPPPKRQATSDTRNSVPKTPCSRFDDLNSTHEAHRLFSRSGRTSTVR